MYVVGLDLLDLLTMTMMTTMTIIHHLKNLKLLQRMRTVWLFPESSASPPLRLTAKMRSLS